MQISDRNTFMPKGNNNYYKGHWNSMFIVFIQESNNLWIALLYYTAIFVDIVYDTEVIDMKPI